MSFPIKVHVSGTTTIALYVEPSDTVYQLKTQIQSLIAGPPNEQRLSLRTEKVEIELMNGEKLSMKWGASDTIEKVRGKLRKEHSLPCHYDPKLIFTGVNISEALDGHQTLAHYTITEGSDLYYGFGSSMQIFLKGFEGRTTTFDVLPTTTVGEFKHQILAKKGIQPDDQRLLFAGKQLEDGYTLEQYKITKESTVHLFGRLR